MNEQAIQEQYQHIVALLKQQRLKEAQSQLEAFLWNSGDWPLRNRLEQAQTSYQYMLQYMRQGIDDPERQKLYRQILTETWEVADQARLSLLDGVSTHYYHSLRNNRERLPKEYNIAALQKVLESFPDDAVPIRSFLAVVKDVGTDLHSIPARKKRLNLSVMCWMKS